MTPQELTEYSGEHLFYEFTTFWRLAGIVPLMDGLMQSALLESYLIHLRNLIDFLYRPRDRDDDVIAADFFDDPASWTPTISATLERAQIRANKEMSHLTTKRKSGSQPQKEWDVGGLSKEIWQTTKDFAAKASYKKLHPKVRELFNLPEARLLVAIGAGSNTTNTVSHIMTMTSSPGLASRKNKP